MQDRSLRTLAGAFGAFLVLGAPTGLAPGPAVAQPLSHEEPVVAEFGAGGRASNLLWRTGPSELDDSAVRTWGVDAGLSARESAAAPIEMLHSKRRGALWVTFDR